MVYQQREGHVHVPLRHVEEDGWHLGEWLSEQRRAYKQQRLSATYAVRLQQAGVAWDLQQQHWNDMFTRLQEFRQKHGHFPRQQQHHDAKLGSWLNTQRAAMRNGKMSLNRRAKLEALGVAWNQHHQTWNDMVALLEEYQQRHGHVQVPLRHVEQGRKLGTWWASQRKFLKKGTMTPERRKRLEPLLLIGNITITTTTTATT
ncbi:helicase [Seminavis robusta]|uniref:Helicase n=1 Tax=Seminavis robusta TaxID=568900 RepID=A0A9N8DFA6_9STRA|nr:helicase [Seminavis robusta]|eukprot:Sro116_g057050.1 helicase (202) ;mRNA; r:54349-54954